MLPDLKLSIRLQDLDTRVGELMREIQALPKHIAEIEKKLISHDRKLEADRAALSGNQNERKKMEGEIQIQEQKISKLRGQMSDAKSNDVYRAFLNEIEFCQKEIRKAEDRILDLMGESEPLEENVKTAAVALKAEKADVEREKQSTRERTAADRKALEALTAERAAIVATMDQGIYRKYEGIRRTRNGIAISEAVDRRCAQCHVGLRPQFFQELKRSDQVMYCESCGRILFYNPPESFEDLAAQPAL